ncbi:xanthine dehydrogenase family protein molybdopterin-binding subunit [candidate division KSB1 bacterium]|nr:xanthine dehydrogenase family protein molybdopterin-binding subunit [candidate division KSB1 bacterium]
MTGWKKLNDMTYLGKSYTRVDGPDKVTGRAKYTYDLKFPGMLYGRILRSPHPHAKIISIDASRVVNMPGVKAVLTDIKDEVFFVGDDVAAVAAETEEIANEALLRFKVEYQVLPFTVREEQAMLDDAPKVFSNRDNNIGSTQDRTEGDVEKGFQEADVVVEQTYHINVQVHNPLEVHGCIVKWQDDELYMWDSTQAVHGERSAMARHFKIPENKVHVISHHMGGGFGSKLGMKSFHIICANLAKKAAVPVKLMLDREEQFLAVGNRPSSIQKIKIGAKKDGTLTAFQLDSFGTAGIGGGAGVPQPYIYQFPNYKVNHKDVFINAGAGAPMRAPGHPQANFAMESIMDELAEKLGMDPLELRIKNDPNKTRQQEYLIGAKQFGWDKRLKSGSQKGKIVKGMGLGSGRWSGGGNRETKANVNIYPDGAVDVKIGTQDIGTGARTIVAAVVAEELELDLKDVLPLIGKSDYPWAPASGGSTTTPSISPTVKLAAEKAKNSLIVRVADEWKVTPDQVIYSKKTFTSKDGAQSLSWQEACELLRAPISEMEKWNEGLSDSGTAGCQFVEVEVDKETGHVKVTRMIGVHDCGLVVNMLTTKNQIQGGMIGEIGYVTMENRLLDADTGIMPNADMENYKIPGALEMPDFNITMFDESERGVIGVGEPPAIPGVGAIANAIANAIGAHFYETPITPDKVLMAIQGKEGKS